MYEYPLGDLARMWSAILVVYRDCMAAGAMGKEKMEVPASRALAICLEGLALCCGNFHVDDSLLQQMKTLEKELRDESADMRFVAMHSKLGMIIEGIQNNLESRKFMFLPKEDAAYWNNLLLFGDDFGTVFPAEATFELAEMGKCFAASRTIACVFHCMRIAEYALRILATRTGVKLTDKGKPMPIEYATWDKVIQAMRSKISSARQLPHGRKKAEQLQFYSDAADHCEYMKDIWRNEIAHARHRFYTRDEALGVISRVRLFCVLIAEHEIPKNPRIHLAKINKRVRELQSHYGSVDECAAQRDKSRSGSGETSDSQKKTEG
ncbi:MAG TPA: hypothetical protein VKQ11_07820 [Candidatus Sulfotelmatobacter sp.]|nr:hypothetical protein [Candidatus Sulfotelmatobacter sp.]